MKSVVVCGSKRFFKEIASFCDKLAEAGVLVFRPNISSPIFEHEIVGTDHVTRMVFKGLTLEHFDMIRKTEVCFLYNKDGYVGASVTLELGFANALGRPIYALENTTGDPCRDSLIDDVTPTVKDLIKKLQ